MMYKGKGGFRNMPINRGEITKIGLLGSFFRGAMGFFGFLIVMAIVIFWRVHG